MRLLNIIDKHGSFMQSIDLYRPKKEIFFGFLGVYISNNIRMYRFGGGRI